MEVLLVIRKGERPVANRSAVRRARDESARPASPAKTAEIAPSQAGVTTTVGAAMERATDAFQLLAAQPQKTNKNNRPISKSKFGSGKSVFDLRLGSTSVKKPWNKLMALVGQGDPAALKRAEAAVLQIRELEGELGDLSMDALQDKYAALQGRVAEELSDENADIRALQKEFVGLERSGDLDAAERVGTRIEKLQAARIEERRDVLDEVLPEVFAVASEICWRTLKMRPYDVQLMCGALLSRGKIVEQYTGEGKTLSAIATAALKASTGEGVHIATSSNYLAKRDAQKMAKAYQALGLSVAALSPDGTALIVEDDGSLREAERGEAYQCDIVYGTIAQFGFDHLRDNLVTKREDRVQRGNPSLIMDEVDSLLIDDAMTPLVISGQPGEAHAKTRIDVATVVEGLEPGKHISFDRAENFAYLTEEGMDEVASRLGVRSFEEDIQSHAELHRIVDNAVRARVLFVKGIQYDLFSSDEGNLSVELIGRNGEIMRGRRLSHGLHQAIEAREQALLSGPQRQRELIAAAVSQLRPEHVKVSSENMADPFSVPVGTATLTEEGAKSLEGILADAGIELDVGFGADTPVEIQSAFMAELFASQPQAVTAALRRYLGDIQESGDGLNENELRTLAAMFARDPHLMDEPDLAPLLAYLGPRVEISAETRTAGSIPIRDYIGLYDEVCGMTGTAETSEEIFEGVYHLDVVRVPTHKPLLRIDEPTQLFATIEDKAMAIFRDAQEIAAQGRPVLIGCPDERTAHALSLLFRESEVDFSLLTAKNEAEEAKVIEDAGLAGSITITTPKGGRGVHFELGPGVAERGGMFVLGFAHNDCERIDNQLRGRAGRQGAPGSTRFYASLQDRFFRNRELPQSLIDDPPGPSGRSDATITALVAEHSELSESLMHAQLADALPYDAVIRHHRQRYLDEREVMLDGELIDVAVDISETAAGEFLDHAMKLLAEKGDFDEDNITDEQLYAIYIQLAEQLPLIERPDPPNTWRGLDADELRQRVKEDIEAILTPHLSQLKERSDKILRELLVHHLDQGFSDHMIALEDAKQGAGWHTLAEKDPRQVFPHLAEEAWTAYVSNTRLNVLRTMTSGMEPIWL